MVKPKNGYWCVGKLNGKSKDAPEAVNSRLFVGNLPAVGVQLNRLAEVFAKFGPVLDASLHTRYMAVFSMLVFIRGTAWHGSYCVM